VHNVVIQMTSKHLGPKGQVVIPKRMRDTIGIKPGTQVTLEIREDEIVISKPKSKGKYTEYYTSTRVSKLKKPVNIKEIISEEVCGRHALP
jgi:AbrB family looped-hinge helix DNA binding protein